MVIDGVCAARCSPTSTWLLTCCRGEGHWRRVQGSDGSSLFESCLLCDTPPNQYWAFTILQVTVKRLTDLIITWSTDQIATANVNIIMRFRFLFHFDVLKCRPIRRSISEKPLSHNFHRYISLNPFEQQIVVASCHLPCVSSLLRKAFAQFSSPRSS